MIGYVVYAFLAIFSLICAHGAAVVQFDAAPATIKPGVNSIVKVEYQVSSPFTSFFAQVRLLDPSQKIVVEETAKVPSGSGSNAFVMKVPVGLSNGPYQWHTQIFDPSWKSILAQAYKSVQVGVSSPSSLPPGDCRSYPPGTQCAPNQTPRCLKPLNSGYCDGWYISRTWNGPLAAYFADGKSIGTNFWVEWKFVPTKSTSLEEFDIRVRKSGWSNGAKELGYTSKLKDISTPLVCTYEGRWSKGSSGRCHINLTVWITQGAKWDGSPRSDIIIHAWDNSGNYAAKYVDKYDPVKKGLFNLGAIVSNGVKYTVLKTKPGGIGEKASYNVIPQKFLASKPLLTDFPTNLMSGKILAKDVVDKIYNLEVALSKGKPEFTNEWYVFGLEWTVTGQSSDKVDGVPIPDSQGRWTFTKYSIANLT